MIKRIYNLLSKAYGVQDWWPVTPPGQTQPRYTGGPRNNREKLEVIFGAILTQNTSWKNVEKAISTLHTNDLIDCEKILKIRKDKLARLIKSSGYFNQKALKLKSVAQFLQEYPILKLQKMRTAYLRNLLLEVKGIGPETADSIILYALKKPIFVIDAYTKRIFSRLGYCNQNTDYDELQKLFHQNLKKNYLIFSEYHALLVEHGKNICKKKPLCQDCVLENLCKQAGL
jgi:endonuclease III related protein